MLVSGEDNRHEIQRGSYVSKDTTDHHSVDIKNASSCTTVNSVKDWWLSAEPAQLVSRSCDWPWYQLAPSVWLKLWSDYYELRNYGEHFQTLYSIDYAFGAFGIIGNVLAIMTLSMAHFKQPSYVYHRALVGCDLIYNIIFIVHAWCFLNDVETEKSYLASIVRVTRMGPLYSTSLVSDFISLAISLERMVAACLPVHYRKINSHTFALVAIGCAVVFGVAGRIHYSFVYRVVPRRDPSTGDTRYHLGYSSLWYSRIYKVWYAISDEILPVVVLLVMSTLTVLTIKAIIRQYLFRRRSCLNIPPHPTHTNPDRSVQNAAFTPTSGTPTSTWRAENGSGGIHEKRTIDQREQQTRTATILLIASTSTCLLNQLGYIVCTVAWQVFDHTAINFGSRKGDIEYWLDQRRSYNIAYVLKGILESLARLMYFYVNVVISKQFRTQFINLIPFLKKHQEQCNEVCVRPGGSDSQLQFAVTHL